MQQSLATHLKENFLALTFYCSKFMETICLKRDSQEYEVNLLRMIILDNKKLNLRLRLGQFEISQEYKVHKLALSTSGPKSRILKDYVQLKGLCLNHINFGTFKFR